ncbi:MAG: class I SAM-dependent methyltransferase [Thermodesulfobacteriota bacterium]
MSSQKQIGNFIKRESCRFCGSKNMEKVLDFGNLPLAGGFIKKDDFANEKFYPLSLDLCHDCFLVQISNIVPAEVLFKENYFFFSSQIQSLVDHFISFAKEIKLRFLSDISQPSVFELGCNDGPLLKPLAELGVRAVGVDPATNVVNSIKSTSFSVINDFFSEKLANKIKSQFGCFDIFASSYSFAHIDNMIDIMKGVKCLLKENGVLIFEIYYLGTLIDELQYDMIYHEHMSYYSLKTLQTFLSNFEMEVFDLQYIPGIRSGSVRFYARNIGQRSEEISPAVFKMIEYEENKGFNKVETYKNFSKRVADNRRELLDLLNNLKKENKTIFGYGASGRGTIIMNYCGIDGQYLDFVVDDAPSKQGFYTPGTHVWITSWDSIQKGRLPDYALLFAWAFTYEVLKKRREYIKNGGKFIIPLPKVRVFPD